ncbi:MAG: arylesterase [Rhizobiaceae bacterium]
MLAISIERVCAADKTPTLVVLGDSLVAGYGLAEADAFPAQLELALRASGQDVQVINAGVSGDTTAGGLARLDWSIPADADAVMVELGANDALRGLSPAATRANLEEIIARLKQRGTKVLLAGMLAPPNMGLDYETQFNRIFPDLATSNDIEFYPFFLDGVAARRDLNQADGIHPNPEGVRILVERLLPTVMQLLAKSASDG